MQRTFTRTRSESPNDPLTMSDERSLFRCIDELITEFQWGGQVEDREDDLLVTAKVFGCTDVTTFAGSDADMLVLRGLVEHRSKVNSYLLGLMGIPYIYKEYTRCDILTLLELYLADPTAINDWSSLLTSTLTVVRDNKIDLLLSRAMEAKTLSAQLRDVGLDTDDGVFGIIASYPLAI